MSLGVYGHVRARIIRNGRTVETWDGPNVITTAGRDALVRALAGDLAQPIVDVGAGTGSVAADQSDTDLQAAVVWRPIEQITAVGGGVLRVRWEIPTGAATGSVLTEIGLRAPDGTLVARRVRAVGVPMDPDVALQGEWDITLVEA